MTATPNRVTTNNINFEFIDKVANSAKTPADKALAENVRGIVGRLAAEETKSDFSSKLINGSYLEDMATVIKFANRYLKREQIDEANPFHFRSDSPGPQLISRPFPHFCEELELHTLDIEEHAKLPKDLETGRVICPISQRPIDASIEPKHDYYDQKRIYTFALESMGVLTNPESENIESPRTRWSLSPPPSPAIDIVRPNKESDDSMFFSQSL